MLLSDIRAEVDRRVQLQHKQIVMAAFQHMCNKHNDLRCGCTACDVLREYVRTKLHAHRCKRRLDTPYEYIGTDNFVAFFQAKERARWLKTQRTRLKLVN